MNNDINLTQILYTISMTAHALKANISARNAKELAQFVIMAGQLEIFAQPSCMADIKWFRNLSRAEQLAIVTTEISTLFIQYA